MNIGLSYMTQIRGGEDTGQLVGDTAEEGAPKPERSSRSLGGWIALTFNQLVASLTAAYHREHNADDTHGAIHCTSISERGRAVPVGVWILVPVTATTFGTVNNVTSWTVPTTGVTRLAYTLVGKTMTVAFYLQGTSVAAATAQFLTIRVPGAYVSASATFNPIVVINNGVRAAGYAGVNAPSSIDSNFIYLEAGGVNWSVSAANTTVAGEISFEVL